MVSSDILLCRLSSVGTAVCRIRNSDVYVCRVRSWCWRRASLPSVSVDQEPANQDQDNDDDNAKTCSAVAIVAASWIVYYCRHNIASIIGNG